MKAILAIPLESVIALLHLAVVSMDSFNLAIDGSSNPKVGSEDSLVGNLQILIWIPIAAFSSHLVAFT